MTTDSATTLDQLARKHTKTCTCGRRIILAATTSGDTMPVNAAPDYTGNVILSTTDGELYAGVLGRNQSAGAYARGAVLYRPHWADCPDAAKHRKRDR